MREALLRGAAIFWAGFDALLTEDRTPQLHAFTGGASRSAAGFPSWPVKKRWTPVDALRTVPFLHIELPRPAYADRLHLWQEAVDPDRARDPAADDLDLISLANKFRFTGGEIRDAATTAANMARLPRSASNPGW